MLNPSQSPTGAVQRTPGSQRAVLQGEQEIPPPWSRPRPAQNSSACISLSKAGCGLQGLLWTPSWSRALHPRSWGHRGTGAVLGLQLQGVGGEPELPPLSHLSLGVAVSPGQALPGSDLVQHVGFSFSSPLSQAESTGPENQLSWGQRSHRVWPPQPHSPVESPPLSPRSRRGTSSGTALPHQRIQKAQRAEQRHWERPHQLGASAERGCSSDCKGWRKCQLCCLNQLRAHRPWITLGF